MSVELPTAFCEASLGPQQRAPCSCQAKLVLAENNSSLPTWMEPAHMFGSKLKSIHEEKFYTHTFSNIEQSKATWMK